jgi:hypothetical protein
VLLINIPEIEPASGNIIGRQPDTASNPSASVQAASATGVSR